MEDNRNTQNEMEAYQLAMKLYDGFYNALMEAVENSIKNFNNAQLQCRKPRPDEAVEDGLERIANMYYYKGKADAFREISDRIKKEHDLVAQPLENWLGGKYMDTWDEFVYRAVKERKNNDAERILPMERLRGTRAADKAFRMRGQLADLLERYGVEGFRLGKEYGKGAMKKEDAEGFDPDRFGKTCIETFTPEDYRHL